MLVYSSNAITKRYLDIDWKWKYGSFPIKFWENYIIEWKVPSNNTMLDFPSTLKTTTIS